MVEFSPADQVSLDMMAFAERLDGSGLLELNNREATPIDLIGELQNIASEHVDFAAHLVEDIEDMDPEEDADEQQVQELENAKETLKYWEMEHQTWELFGTLITHRINTEGLVPDAVVPTECKDMHRSDVTVREYFFDADPVFRELVIVLQWLRRYAPGPTVDDIENNGFYRSDRGWMYTKEVIKGNKRLRGGRHISLPNGFMSKSAARNTVTELDPDAPSRQRALLEEEDEAWEKYLMKLVWGFLRKGQFSNARDLCADAGEFWRAASITGARHAWDPKIDSDRPIGGLDDEERLDEEDDEDEIMDDAPAAKPVVKKEVVKPKKATPQIGRAHV